MNQTNYKAENGFLGGPALGYPPELVKPPETAEVELKGLLETRSAAVFEGTERQRHNHLTALRDKQVDFFEIDKNGVPALHLTPEMQTKFLYNGGEYCPETDETYDANILRRVEVLGKTKYEVRIGPNSWNSVTVDRETKKSVAARGGDYFSYILRYDYVPWESSLATFWLNSVPEHGIHRLTLSLRVGTIRRPEKENNLAVQDVAQQLRELIPSQILSTAKADDKFNMSFSIDPENQGDNGDTCVAKLEFYIGDDKEAKKLSEYFPDECDKSNPSKFTFMLPASAGLVAAVVMVFDHLDRSVTDGETIHPPAHVLPKNRDVNLDRASYYQQPLRLYQEGFWLIEDYDGVDSLKRALESMRSEYVRLMEKLRTKVLEETILLSVAQDEQAQHAESRGKQLEIEVAELDRQIGKLTERKNALLMAASRLSRKEMLPTTDAVLQQVRNDLASAEAISQKLDTMLDS